MIYENDVLILRKPTIDDAQKVWDLRQEFIDNDDRRTKERRRWKF